MDLGWIEFIAAVIEHNSVFRSVDRKHPHHQGVFAVICIVVPAEGAIDKSVFPVEILSGEIAFTHFQSHVSSRHKETFFDKVQHQPLSDFSALKVWIDGDCSEMRLFPHDPHPTKTYHFAIKTGYHIAGGAISKFRLEGGFSPGEWETTKINSMNSFQIRGEHRLH